MIIKEEGLLISVSTSSITKYEERSSHENQRGRTLDFLVDKLKTKYEERTSRDNQRERQFDFFVDHFLNKCEVRTIRENKDEPS